MTVSTPNAKLTLADIADLRAYERERDEFRRRIIELKKLRRVGIGPIVTAVFENRDTVRFQIQEMARAERMLTDQQIQTELDVYNPLIPEPGQLVATLFIELTSKADLMEWLPKLVGIERALELRIGSGAESHAVRSAPNAEHESQLTREEITPSVHYVHFALTPDQVEAFDRGPVAVAVVHPNYHHVTELSDAAAKSLLVDLRGAV